MSDSDGDNGHAIASLNVSSRKRDHRRQDVSTVGHHALDSEEDSRGEMFLETLLNPNFDELARQFRYFQKVYNKKQRPPPSSVQTLTATKKKKHLPVASYITTPEFTLALSRALLHVHFGLSLTVEDAGEMEDEQYLSDSVSSTRFLCPPIPNRFFYVQWIVETILPMIRGNDSDKYFELSSSVSPSAAQQARNSIYGLDIGTGATCIYPLLMSHYNRKRLVLEANDAPIVVMHATDVDPLAVQWAKTNVSANQLQKLVHIHLVPKSSSQLAAQSGTSMNMDVDHNDSNSVLLPPVQDHCGPLIRSLEQIQSFLRQPSLDVATSSNDADFQLDFVMTNPPFYDSQRGKEDLTIDCSTNHIYDSKLQALRGRTTLMTVNEGYYPNGEVGFGLDLIRDSWNLFVAANTQSTCPPVGSSTPSNTSILPLPHWVSMMCGKKSSFIYLQHAISQLLGPSHICTTEFGPGEYTRWFLAWTFHRPTARSPLARMNRAWTFHVPVSVKVSLSSALSKTVACQEVVNRFIEYSRTLSNHSDPGIGVICEESTNPSSMYRTDRKDHGCPQIVRLQMYETRDPLICKSSSVHGTFEGDETLPNCLKSCIFQVSSIDRLSFLPSDCGHYLLDISLKVTNDGKESSVARAIEGHECVVHVDVNSYRHSTYGQKRVEKIRSQLEHEICRTSRRWRRLLQRQPPEGPKLASDIHTMDES